MIAQISDSQGRFVTSRKSIKEFTLFARLQVSTRTAFGIQNWVCKVLFISRIRKFVSADLRKFRV